MKNKTLPPVSDFDEIPDPEDSQARAELAFERSDAYEFGGKKLTFAWDHQAAAGRVGIRLVPGDVLDFLFLLTLPAAEVVMLRGPHSIEGFYQRSAAWARKLGVSFSSKLHTEAIELATRIVSDHEASKVRVLPAKKRAGEQSPEGVPGN